MSFTQCRRFFDGFGPAFCSMYFSLIVHPDKFSTFISSHFWFAATVNLYIVQRSIAGN
jgi:hypothetical protein